MSCTFDLTAKRTKVTKDWENKTLELRDLRVLRGENVPLLFGCSATTLTYQFEPPPTPG
jgi:hypothetical protein